MKSVLLFRHGKSDWDAADADDHDRPLAPRGRAAAALMGHYLADLGQIPGTVLCSTAARARRTVELATAAGEWRCPIEYTRDLYAASPEDVLQRIRACDPQDDRVLLAGHEPTWSLLAGRLIGAAALRFPTAAMARIDLDIESWGDAAFGSGRLIWLVPPKLLSRLGRSAAVN